MLQQRGNIQFEHEPNELFCHCNNLSLAQDVGKTKLILHTYMLSLLLQAPRDRDAMALPLLPLHQPSKKGGSVG